MKLINDLSLDGLRAVTGAGGSTLLDGLVHYWTLEEASDNRADSIGAIPFTEVNGPITNTAGKHDNAAYLTSVQSLSGATGQVGTVAGGWTVSVWGYRTSVGAGWNFYKGGGTYQFSAGFGGGTFFAEVVGGTGDYNDFWTTSPAVIPCSVGAWHHAVVGWDGTQPFAYLDGSALSMNESGVPGTVFMVSAPLFLSISISDPSEYDEAAMWSRGLSADEITELYNSGAGKFYPFV